MNCLAVALHSEENWEDTIAYLERISEGVTEKFLNLMPYSYLQFAYYKVRLKRKLYTPPRPSS